VLLHSPCHDFKAQVKRAERRHDIRVEAACLRENKRTQQSSCQTISPMPAPRREIQVRHAASTSQAATDILRSGRELEKLIAGKSPADTRQIHTVISKLQSVIADYLDSGKPLKITLSAYEILSAIEAAIQEVAGSPSPWPDGADARTFFVHGLYDEIIQQPSNIFETKLFPDGSERYIPISRATWKTCLESLREQIIESGLKIAKKRSGTKAD